MFNLIKKLITKSDIVRLNNMLENIKYQDCVVYKFVDKRDKVNLLFFDWVVNSIVVYQRCCLGVTRVANAFWWPSDENDKVLYLAELYVCEVAQGNGIGSEILKFLIQYAKSKNFDMIQLLSCPEAKNFYKKFGFEKMRESDDEFSDLKLDLSHNKSFEFTNHD